MCKAAGVAFTADSDKSAGRSTVQCLSQAGHPLSAIAAAFVEPALTTTPFAADEAGRHHPGRAC